MTARANTLPAGYRHLALDETASTNTECVKRAEAGDPGKLWITAKRQTAARGSRGRNWQSDEGNLFASLLLVDPGGCNRPDVLNGLTFVAAVALMNAIRRIASAAGADVKLKWPNDVLLNGRKVAGILLENQLINARSALVIGIGVNCTTHPRKTAYRATDLAAEGMRVTAAALFETLAHEMDLALSLWQGGKGFDAIRQLWLQNAAGLGEPIVVKIPGQKDRAGTFETIDASGFLVLKEKCGACAKISAADIFFQN